MSPISSQYVFLFCGFLGLLVGAPFTLYLVIFLRLLPWVEAVLICCAMFVLLAVPLTVKVLSGREGLVFYRDVIFIFTGVTFTLRLLHQPVLPYLDVTIAGAGIFHAFGRIGCLFAGCCFGRPFPLGVRYGQVHADMGFPSELVGVRLFPVQLLESLWILCLVGLTSVLILRHSAPGLAVAVYISGYAVGRFVFEFARGDVERPYLAGFSHAQWISWLLTLGVGMGGLIGVLPRRTAFLYAAPVLAVTMLLVKLCRLRPDAGRFELLHPRHVLEVAALLRHLSASVRNRSVLSAAPAPRHPIEVVTTSLGLHLSVDRTQHRGRPIHIYSLSGERALSPRCVRILARLISRLQHDSTRFEVLDSGHGVVHILFAA